MGLKEERDKALAEYDELLAAVVKAQEEELKARSRLAVMVGDLRDGGVTAQALAERTAGPLKLPVESARKWLQRLPRPSERA